MTFTDRLAAAEREILALKTAHTRGAGVITFFSKSASASISPDEYGGRGVKVTATVNGDATTALVQLQLSTLNSRPWTTDDYSASGNTIIWTFGYEELTETITVSAKVMATVGITSLAVEGWSF